MKKVLFGYPNTGMTPVMTQVAVTDMIMSTQNNMIEMHSISNSLIHNARNACVDKAVKGDYDYLLFVDSDMTPPKDMIDRLAYYLEKYPECGIVGLMAFKRVKPHMPCFYSKVAVDETGKPKLEMPLEWDEGLLKVEGTGMACCMIRVEALKKLYDKGITRPFDMETQLGEDIEFCVRVRELGYEIYVDTSAEAGHVSMIPIGKQHFDMYKKIAVETGKSLVEMEDGSVC